MARLRHLLAACLLAPWPFVAAAELKDLYFGEALFHAHQGDYFDAIMRLDIEIDQYHSLDDPYLDTLHFHIGAAEFSVGDFELNYRMHNRAGRAIRAVLEGDVAPDVRNEAVYRLARIFFEKGQPAEALNALQRITHPLPERVRDDEAYLRAQVYMANGRFAEAIPVLRGLQHSKRYEGFAGYNLAIALFGAGQEQEARLQLARAGQVRGSAPATLAIRDRSNLVLGTRLMEQAEFDQAGQYLDRVRLTGPFSNRALLTAGWAAVAAEQYDRALVPWGILAERNVTDKAVQEALLALPYAYGKLEVHGRAAVLYGTALETFGREIDRLEASVYSIRQGHFLQALTREELKQDADWVVKLRQLPEAPETYYLLELLASHDFQASLKNYLDLEHLRRRTAAWDEYLNAFEELIALRRAYYEPLLPKIDREFRRLDAQLRLRLEQRAHVARQLQSMLTMPRHEFLITAPERELREQLAVLEAALDPSDPLTQAHLQRIERLRGVLGWDIRADYHQRLTDAFANLRALDQEIEHLNRVYASFVRTRQAATQSYQGYDDSLRSLKLRARRAGERIASAMAEQGALLEALAVEELESRRLRLEEYQVKARFALADSYDRATLKQSAEPLPE